MEDLTIEEVKQLVNFYRQRLSESEFQALQLQIKLNRVPAAPDSDTKSSVAKK